MLPQEYGLSSLLLKLLFRTLFDPLCIHRDSSISIIIRYYLHCRRTEHTKSYVPHSHRISRPPRRTLDDELVASRLKDISIGLIATDCNLLTA